jgi:hypothetical protein
LNDFIREMVVVNKKKKQTDYVLFCGSCGVPEKIPAYIMKTYFVTEVDGVYCKNCECKTVIPEYLKKIAKEL